MSQGRSQWPIQPEVSEREKQRVPWTVGDAVSGLVLLAVISIFLGAVIEALRVAGVVSRIEAFRVFAPVSVVVMFLLAWLFAIARRGGTWADLGIRKSGWLSDFGLALLAEVGVLLVVMAYATLLLYLTKLRLPQQPVVELFGRSPTGIALAVLYVAILAPIGEEVFFRGFLYGAMRQRWGVGVGMVVSAALFAFFHLSPLLYVPMFTIGLALAALYQYRGSLAPAIMLHALNNLLALVVLFAG